MFKYKEVVFVILILFFLLFSFYPTLFELSHTNKLADPNREFILEHNYYWPDFNLYLSKIRQGFEGHLTALERYTSEPHRGSLIQEFYVVLGLVGRFSGLDPNFSYQLGRLALSPLLLFIVLALVRFYFKSFYWQVLAFVIIFVSGSFPRFYFDPQGVIRIGRYMEWWSNIDALQRITFIPHILFGQAVSFFLLYQLAINNQQLTIKKLLFYIFLGNAVGLVFPPSLITLDSVILLTIFTSVFTKKIAFAQQGKIFAENFRLRAKSDKYNRTRLLKIMYYLLFIIFTLPSLLYFLIITKYLPWSTLVIFHRTHPMMIPFTEYILGTGPILFLGLAGGVVSIIKRDRKFQPFIFWILVTFFFAIVFTHINQQSPLRFTQTGLFIPLGILGTYFFYSLFHLSDLLARRSFLGLHSFSEGGSEGGSHLRNLLRPTLTAIIILYTLGNLYMMKTSLDWQINWISQRITATLPPVPYPPQTMYPLRQWMDGIRWLRDNTNRGDVVLAEITAGNHIPAYAGNTVYLGQANTVDYERKQAEVWEFLKGEMGEKQAQLFLKNGRIKYIFFSVQEKEKSGGKPLEDFYPFLTPVYTNPTVTIFTL